MSYTYGVNNISKLNDEQAKYINITDKEKITEDIENLKSNKVDYICVNMHWGDSSSSTINSEQEELANFLIESGVDLIYGTHPTSIQKMEVKQNADGKNVFIAYSTGNFLSTSTNTGMILNVTITKNLDTEITNLSTVVYHPIYLLDNGKNTASNRFSIIDSKQTVETYEKIDSSIISTDLYKKLKKSIESVDKIVNEN